MDIDRLMSRLNPAIAAILRSPAHWLLSSGLMLITVTGRRTGRRYEIPVGYQRRDDRVWVLVSKPRRKQWWWNYAEPAPVELCLQGRRRRGEARVVASTAAEFHEVVEATLRRLPYLGRQFGVSTRRGVSLSDTQWRTLAREVVLIAIALDQYSS